MLRLYIILLFIISVFRSYGQDTLRNLEKSIPLSFYPFPNPKCGFLTGQNCYGREIYAEKYYITGNVEVIGVISHLTGVATKPERLLAFELYNVGENRLPKEAIAKKFVKYGDLDLSGNPVTALFDKPVNAKDSFFVALNFLDYAHESFTDTIALYCGEDGSRSIVDLKKTGRNAVKYHDDAWYDFYQKTVLRTHFAMFPIVNIPVTGFGKDVLKIEELTLKKLFPNPADNNLNVAFSLGKPSYIELQILDVTGKILRKRQLGERMQGDLECKLPITGLSNGTYILVIKSQQTSLASTFIKN